MTEIIMVVHHLDHCTFQPDFSVINLCHKSMYSYVFYVCDKREEDRYVNFVTIVPFYILVKKKMMVIKITLSLGLFYVKGH